MAALKHALLLPPHPPPRRGFTLIELLLVISIAGITLGLASLKFRPDGQRSLQDEAQRLASLMQVAGDEAILRNRPIMFEADAHRYHFMIRMKGAWLPIANDDMLRSREFAETPLALRMTPDAGTGTGKIRIVFEPQPVGRSFVLTMSSNDATVGIRADGLGQYAVE